MAWTTTTTRSTGFLVTAAVWNAEHVDNMQHLEEIGFAFGTSNVVIDVTTSATSTLVIALPSITYTAEQYILYFECPSLQRTETAAGTPSLFFGVYDGAAGSPLARMGQVQLSSTNSGAFTISKRYYLPTLSAAAHTLQIRAYTNTADSWTFLAGSAGGDVFGPMTLAVYKVPT